MARCKRRDLQDTIGRQHFRGGPNGLGSAGDKQRNDVLVVAEDYVCEATSFVDARVALEEVNGSTGQSAW
jgi:hypothetical protein